MPIFDDDRGQLVVRLVYDGAPRSGKTTSLRTLAADLGVEVVTPEERDGRTLFFDWLDYVGGRFEGYTIRCQAVSVPGQRELAARRHALLASADAIVLVADCDPAGLDRACEALRELRPFHRFADPPVGLLFQANKRDAPDAVSRDAIDTALRSIAPVAVVETVALDGRGVREAFVLAIRLALDRVRALSERGSIPRGLPREDGPDELLDALRAIDLEAPLASPRPHTPATARASVEPEAAPISAPAERARVLDSAMPGGLIWPPVDGRTLVHAAARHDLRPSRLANGDWSASAGGWRLHSEAAAGFDDEAAARSALLGWARLHAAHQRLLSPGRAVLLADPGDGRLRLWQLVHVVASLREALADVADAAPEVLARALSDGADHLGHAHDAFWLHAPTLGLRSGLWTVSGDLKRTPSYVGLMPTSHEPTPSLDTSALLHRELAPLLRHLAAERGDFSEVARALHRGASGSRARAALSALVAGDPWLVRRGGARSQ